MLELKYFVLKPRSKFKGDSYAKASRAAMKTYAEMIADTDLELSIALKQWVRREEKNENSISETN